MRLLRLVVCIAIVLGAAGLCGPPLSPQAAAAAGRVIVCPCCHYARNSRDARFCGRCGCPLHAHAGHRCAQHCVHHEFCVFGNGAGSPTRLFPAPGPNGSTRAANPRDGAQMVWVRPGECLLGDDGQYGNPRHRCYLDGYWIYKSPVTVGQYRAFCNASRRRMPPAPYGGWMDSRPIVNVTWNDALAYARWAGVTLPTEAQWEKAARGDQGQRYPWGDGWDLDRLWCSSDRDVRTTAAPAGSYPEGASPCGALDMAGNVKQWCADYYSPGYPEHAPHRNPSGPEQSDRRAVRGSSFNEYYDRAFVSSRREGEPPGDAVSDTGFRCATPVYAP